MRTGKIAPIRPILSSEILFWTRKSMPRELEAREDLFREVREIPRPNLQRSMKKKAMESRTVHIRITTIALRRGLCVQNTHN
jgi:hypothetical protein